MARPKLHSSLPTKNKSRDPNRRKICKSPANLKGLTEEEKHLHKRKQQMENYWKVRDDEKRLEHLKEPPTLLKRDSEPYDVFLKRVREKNRKRLDEILADPELMWRIFADRDDMRTVEAKELREKAKENKKYITDKEIDAVMNEIYGGIKRVKVDEEEDDDFEFKNPYEINE